MMNDIEKSDLLNPRVGAVAQSDCFSTLGEDGTAQLCYLIRQLIDEADLSILQSWISGLRSAGRMSYSNESCTRFYYHNDERTLTLAYQLWPAVREITRRPVSPTYTFISVYNENTGLDRHIDRDGCDVTISIYVDDQLPSWKDRNLLYLGPEKNPLILTGRKGDGVLFFGRNTAHWRPKNMLSGEITTLLLHYQ